MRRPIVFLLLSFLIGHLAFINLSWCLTLLIIYIVCLIAREHRVALLCITGIGLILGYLLTSAFYKSHLALPRELDSEVNLEGIFYEDSPLSSKSGRLIVKSLDKSLNNKQLKLYFNENLNLKLPQTGSVVRIKGSFKAPSFPRNRYRFNERLYMASKASAGSIFVKQIHLIPGGDKLELVRGKLLRKSLEKLLNFTALDQGPIAVGMLLGADDLIDESTQEAFKKTGLMHLLSISGAHFAVLFYYLNQLTERTKGAYWLKKTINYSCIIGFVWLIGSPMAAVRALLMFLILEAMRRFRRQPDGLNALAICLFLVLCLNPFAFWDVGLQLASLAMVAIVCVVPLCHRLLGLSALKANLKLNQAHDSFYKIKLTCLNFIAECYTGFVVSLVMMPLLSYYFYQVQWVGIVLGPLLTLLATAYLPLGALQLIMPFEFLSVMIGSISGIILKAMSFISLRLADWIRYDSIPSGGGFTIGLLLVGLGLILAYKHQARLKCLRSRETFVISAVAICLIAAVEIPQFMSPLVLKSIITQKSQIVALDVGQGDSTLIITASGKTILMDTGLDKGRLQAFETLLSLGIKKIDYLVLSHPHDDHYGGIEKLLSHIKIGEFLYYEGNYSAKSEDYLNDTLKVFRELGTIVKPVSQGDQITFSPQESMTVLWPKERSEIEDENDQSLVIHVQLKEVAVLMTGDISSKVECDIINLVPKTATILKLAHHGSKYSNDSAFLSNPAFIFAYGQAGLNNRYKHPHVETLNRLKTRPLDYLTTNESGAIFIEVNKGYIEYTYERLRTQGQWR